MDKPFGQRACDGLVLGFAAWTVLCHATVLLGGGLDHLLAASLALLLALGAAAAVRRARRRAPAASDAEPGPADAPVARPLPAPLLAAALAAGLGIAALALLGEDPRLAWWPAVLYFGALGLLLRRLPGGAPAAGHVPRARGLVLVLAVAGAALPLVAHTSSPDDGFYLNLAVAAADHPRAPLLRSDTLHGVPDLPLLSAVYRVHSLEVLGGALARLTPLTATQACHWVLPALFGAAFVLASAALVRHLAPRTWPWTLLALLAVLVLVREGLQYHGSFTLLRMHQGKSVLAAVLAPLVVLHGLRFAEAPSRRCWLLLACAQVAAVGASSSGLWAAPVLAGLALAAGLPPGLGAGPALRRLGIGLAASGYVVAAGLLVLRAGGSALQGDLSEEGVQLVRLDAERITDGAQLVRATWLAVFGTGALAAAALVAVASAWAAAPTERARRLSIVFPLGVLLFLLNPATALLVAERVTGGATYWRVLWALPVPLFLALLLAAPARWTAEAERPAARAAGGALSLLATAAFVLLVPSQPFAKGIRWQVLGLKTPSSVAYEAALRLRDAAPPGSHVLAPSGVATWVVTLHGHPFPLALRPNWLAAQEPRLGAVETERRRQLLRFVTGYPVAGGAALLRASLERDALAAVVVYVPGINAAAQRTELIAAGFRLAFANAEYEVWSR